MTGMEEIEAERRRQIEVEGFDTAHDDDLHEDGSLGRAAAAYERNALDRGGPDADPPRGFPWERRWWKPKDPRRDLVRAGALYLAEAERTRRAFDAYARKAGPQSLLRWKHEREYRTREATHRDSARRCAKAIDAMDALASASA